MQKMLAIFMTLLLFCSGCDGNGTAQGGGTDNSKYAHAKIGLPF